MGTEGDHRMTEAFECDVCSAVAKGKPYGILKLRKKGGGINAELCESCYDMIADQVANTD